MPNAFRSLLFGGIEPVSTTGSAVSSFVPWVKDSSLAPLAVSSFQSTPSRKPVASPPVSQSIDGEESSTLRFASWSISKLLPARGNSGWLANAATCTPMTIARMAPIANTIVRLPTTHSPTHYLLSLSLGSCDAEADACETVEPINRSGPLKPILLFSLRNPLSLCRKRIDYWQLGVIECLQGSGLSCIGA